MGETFRQSQKFDGQTCLFKDFDEKVLDFQVRERRKKNKHVFSNTNEEEKGCGSKHPSFCAS